MVRRRTAQDRAALERFELWARELGLHNGKLMQRCAQRRVGVDFLLDAIAGLYEREGVELKEWTDVDDLFGRAKVNVHDLFDEDDEF
jgi:hypothetical protein